MKHNSDIILFRVLVQYSHCWILFCLYLKCV